MINSNYLMDHFLYEIFKIILCTLQQHETMTDNAPIRIYMNKIQNKNTFKIYTWNDEII